MSDDFKKAVEIFESIMSTRVTIYWDYDVNYCIYKVLICSKLAIGGRHFQTKLMISDEYEHEPKRIFDILFEAYNELQHYTNRIAKKYMKHKLKERSKSE